MTGGIITGVGKSLPARIVSNREIAERLGVDDEWILSRTGIRERRHASRGETTSTLGAEAATEALGHAGISAGDVDLIITATCTPDHLFPSTACLIQAAIGAGRAGAFDLNAACSGFIYALAAAQASVTTGLARRVLVVGADVLSRFVNPDDPITAPLFGDGAGAAVVEAGDGEPIRFDLKADGNGAQHVILEAGGSRTPASKDSVERGLHCLTMAGREVFRSAVRAMSSVGQSLGRDGFDLLIGHQANLRILNEAAQEMGVEPERLFVNIDRVANTSAASIPIAIHEAWQEGRLTPGTRLLLLAFGAGFTWAGALLDWTLPSAAHSTTAEDLAAVTP
ncbi:MAG: beta-ketoacyl-ACP synthase III [Actinomycetota bacterium]